MLATSGRIAHLRAASPPALISYVPSFYDFAVVCQLLSQTQSRLQMAEEVGTFLASLDLDEAEIAAQIPGAKLHIIPDVGHAFMDAREEFLKIFVPFVKSHPLLSS